MSKYIPTTRRGLSRRQLLKAVGSSALLMPFVPLLSRAQSSAPKRLVFLYSSNGTVHEQWVPQMVGGELQLSLILEPLEAMKSRLTVVEGLRYKVNEDKGEQSGHEGGINTALTGTRSVVVDPLDPNRSSRAQGISIDQHVGQSIGGGLKFPSLELGVQVQLFDVGLGSLSYAGANQPMPPENDPDQTFQRVFADFVPPEMMPATPDPAAVQRLADRRSVLDFVRGDLARLEGRLGAEERHKVSAHLEAVRDIEKALEIGVGAGASIACAVPDTGVPFDHNANDNIPMLSRLDIDMLVMAMACDLTRVGTVQHGRAGAEHRLSWLGPEFLTDPDNGPTDGTGGIHGLSHNESNPESRAKLARCHQWYAGEMAYLMQKLDSIPEGDGTMLDNTLVVWMNEMGIGGAHLLEKTPWVLGGNLDGHFKTGQLVSAPDVPHNQLLCAIANGFGLGMAGFGDPDYAGELPGLT